MKTQNILSKLAITVLILIISLSSTAQTLDDALNTILTQNGYPGMAVGVVKSNELVYEGYLGMANIATNQPVDANTSFMMASVSKHFVHCAANIAVESGAITSLNEPINNYLSFSVSHPSDPTTITLAMLLNHTSGIDDNWPVMPYQTSEASTPPLGPYLQDYLLPTGTIYDAALNFQPTIGSYHYSNIGYALAAHVVEQATGMDFITYTHQTIFDPLCMTRTSFTLDSLDIPHIALPYNAANSPQVHYSYSDYPSGRLRATVRDLAGYAIAMLNDGTIDGVSIMSNTNFLNAGHSGGDIGVRTLLQLDKATDEAIIILTNGEQGTAAIRDSVLAYMPQLNTTSPDELTCCDYDLTTYEAVLDNPAYQVINDLTSDGLIQNGSTIRFEAGNTITLEAGFCVENNVEFSAEISACNE